MFVNIWFDWAVAVPVHWTENEKSHRSRMVGGGVFSGEEGHMRGVLFGGISVGHLGGFINGVFFWVCSCKLFD